MSFLRHPLKLLALAGSAFVLLGMKGCLFGNDSKQVDDHHVSRGFYAVTYPGYGYLLSLDSTYQVLWTPSDSATGGTVRIQLYQGDRLIVTLSSGLPNNGVYSWSLPSSKVTSGYRIGSGEGYRLRITDVSDTTKWDFSRGFGIYSLYSGSLSVTAPVAGAVAKMDSALSIRWQSTGTLGTYVGAQLFKDTALAATITSLAGNNGTHQWSRLTTTQGSGNDYRVRVFSIANPTVSALSEPFRVSSLYEGSFQITSPKSGDTIPAGTSAQVAWTVSGTPGSTASLGLYLDSTLVSSLSSGSTVSLGSLSWSVNQGFTTSSRYRIRIASVQDKGIAAWSDFFTIKGSEPVSFEPDESASAAKSIEADGKAQNRTLTYQDQDWIRFQADAGKRYLVTVQSNYSLYVYAHDSSGAQIASQGGQSFQVQVNPTRTGRHSLRVQTVSSYGPYAIALTAYDSTQSAAPAKFTAPDTLSTWAAGSVYSVTWTPDVLFYGSYVALALYRDSVRVQSISSSVSNSGTYAWNIPAGLPTSDRYRIRMTSSVNTQIFGYSRHFTISGQAADSFEPDNQRSAARDIPADGTPQARTLTFNDSDWVRFTAVPGKRYLATLSSGFSCYLYTLDSNGQQLGSTSGSKLAVPLLTQGPGRYFLRVQPSSSFGPYTLGLIAHDSSESAFPARFTAPDSASTWATGSAYTIAWTPDSALFGTYVNLELNLGTTSLLTLSSTIANSGTYSWSVPAGLATSNRYRIKLSNYNNAQIYGFSPYFSVSGLPADSLEPNDTAGAARLLVPNAGRRSATLSYRDKDWFRFNAKAQTLYVVQAISASTLPTTLKIFSGLGAAQKTIGSKTGSDSLNSLAYFSDTAGVHSFSVEPYSQSSSYHGVYGLEFKEYGEAEFKFNVTQPAAGATVARGAALPIQWSNPADVRGTIDIFLYTAEGVVQTVTAGSNNTGSWSWTVPLALAPRADYYLRVISRIHPGISGNSGVFTVTP